MPTAPAPSPSCSSASRPRAGCGPAAIPWESTCGSATRRTGRGGRSSASSATCAWPRDVIRLVLGSGLAVVGGGLAAGMVVALAATRFLRGSLYGITATDPATLAGATVILLLVALAAHGLPLARAMRIDPSEALRQE